MNKISILLLTCLLSLSSAPVSAASVLKRCFLLQELDSGNLIRESDPSFCAQRAWPFSSFKVALAAMGFASGALRDENTTFQWDMRKQPFKSWERDHTVMTWLENSVVWYSQRLTPLIGIEKIQGYLKDFQYGNQDFSGGFAEAWLGSSLRISPREQLSFLRRLARKELKLSSRAAELTISLLPVAIKESDIRVTGKTGTGFSWGIPAPATTRHYSLGWYVGYATLGTKRYAFTTLIEAPAEKGRFRPAGAEARDYTLEQLKKIPGKGFLEGGTRERGLLEKNARHELPSPLTR